MRLQRLSVLIFSKDDVDKAAALIKDVYEIADQIVLVDSSSRENLERLRAIEKELVKLEVFHTIALGYADPLRMFGLRRCKHDWVLHLDTDERINEALKKDVKRIIDETKAHAFAVKRYEEAHLNGGSTAFFTWQIRLYNRNFVRFKGIIHEQPIVEGTVEKLDGRYRMLHIIELKGSTAQDYTKMWMFERFSYATFNERILDYAFKVSMPAQRDVRKTAIGGFIYGVLRCYETLGFKKENEEVSDLDYFTLYSLRDLAFQIKMRSVSGVLRVLPNNIRYLRTIRERRSAEDSKEMFEISKDIERMGIIRYLMLDDDDMIGRLNEKYAGTKQGIDLLIKLLEDRYHGRYP